MLKITIVYRNSDGKLQSFIHGEPAVNIPPGYTKHVADDYDAAMVFLDGGTVDYSEWTKTVSKSV